MISPLLTVTVNALGPVRARRRTSPASPPSSAICYSPCGEAANVTGTLTCTTTATNTSAGRHLSDQRLQRARRRRLQRRLRLREQQLHRDEAPLTVTADNQSRLLARRTRRSPRRSRASCSARAGDVGRDRSAACTTTAMPFSPGGATRSPALSAAWRRRTTASPVRARHADRQYPTACITGPTTARWSCGGTDGLPRAGRTADGR